MKILPFTSLASLALICCAACAGPRARTPLITMRGLSGSESAKAPPASLRTSERVVAYPVARYIDPNYAGILHEAHTVYRVESRPHWNLRPGTSAGSLSPGAAAGSSGGNGSLSINRSGSGSAERALPSCDELLLEMQRQKTASAALWKSHQSLEKQVTALSAALSSSFQDSDRRAQLEKALEATQARLTGLESALSSGTPSMSSDAASPTSPGGTPRKSAKPTGWDW